MVPSGDTVSEGQGTESIKVNWGTTAGTIAVNATNGCGISAPSQLTVAFGTLVPSISIYSYKGTGISSGVKDTLCAKPVNQGAAKILVNFGTAAGTISVKATTGCGSSAPATLGVTLTSLFASAKSGSNAKEVLNVTTALKAYPNPAKSIATVAFTAAAVNAYEIQVFTATGKMVLSKSGITVIGLNEVNLHMGRLSAATYCIRLVDKEKGTRVITLIKQN